jgi:hypothetical protein
MSEAPKAIPSLVGGIKFRGFDILDRKEDKNLIVNFGTGTSRELIDNRAVSIEL